MQSKKVLELAVTVGERLTFNGCATHQTEDQVYKVLGAYPYTKKEVFISAYSIIVTVESEEAGLLTMVKHFEKKGMNQERIALIEGVVTSFVRGHISAGSAIKSLRNIANKSTYTFPVTVAAFAISGAFRSFMFGGTIYDFIASLVVGTCVGITLQYLNTHKLPSFIVTMSAGFAVGFVSVLLRNFHIGTNLDKIIIGSLITFAPGVPMAHAVNDILNGEYLSGWIRSMEAIISGVAIAIGIAFALYFWAFIGGVN